MNDDFVKMGFRDLQNYTTLKLIDRAFQDTLSFRDLQNYTTLKRNVQTLLQ